MWVAHLHKPDALPSISSHDKLLGVQAVAVAVAFAYHQPTQPGGLRIAAE